jgi:hypothetical protein
VLNWDITRNNLADWEFNGKDGEMDFIVAVPAGDIEGYGFYIHFIKKIITNTTEEYRISEGKYYNYEETSSGFFDGLR